MNLADAAAVRRGAVERAVGSVSTAILPASSLPSSPCAARKMASSACSVSPQSHDASRRSSAPSS